MSAKNNAQTTPDWEKVQEVALALLCISGSHRRNRLQVRPLIPCLEEFESGGWIVDSNTALGWIELTEAGQAHARALFEKHFGIVIPTSESTEDGTAR